MPLARWQTFLRAEQWLLGLHFVGSHCELHACRKDACLILCPYFARNGSSIFWIQGLSTVVRLLMVIGLEAFVGMGMPMHSTAQVHEENRVRSLSLKLYSIIVFTFTGSVRNVRNDVYIYIYIYIYMYIYMSTIWRTQSRYIIFWLYFGKIHSFAPNFISEESFPLISFV